MTGKEAVKALVDGREIKNTDGQHLKRVNNKLCIWTEPNPTWDDANDRGWTIDSIIRRDNKDSWKIVKPKPEKPKYLGCWGVNKGNELQFGPMSTNGRGFFNVGEYEFETEKELLDHCHIYGPDGNLIKE